MNRKEFFKLTSLGAGAAFLVPTLLASSWTDKWEAEDAVKFAIDYARKQNASYADGCIGPCLLIGNADKFAPESLLVTDLLGMRICTPNGWRQIVLREFTRKAIQQNLDSVFDANRATQPEHNYWIAAHFSKEKTLAHLSSDSSLGPDLNTAMLRYGQPQVLPENGPHILFCDILLHQ